MATKKIKLSELRRIVKGILKENETDLFQHSEKQPKELKFILDKYNEKIENGLTYEEVKNLEKEVNKIGYTFDYGLDAVPYNLRKMKD